MPDHSPALPLPLPTTHPAAGFTDIVSEGQQLQISRYLATGAEGGSLYLRVGGWAGGLVLLIRLARSPSWAAACMTCCLHTAVLILRRFPPCSHPPPLAVRYRAPTQVEEVGGGNVRCVAQNSALLDGLLTVMICHTDNEDFRGDFGLPLLTEHDVDCIRTLG